MKKTKRWKINKEIKAKIVRLIDETGKQVGDLSLEKAFLLASKSKLDLVEVGPNNQPPVVKMVDLGKFFYQIEKKERRQKSQTAEVKEVRFSPFIAENDFNTRIERIKDFLAERNKVKIVIKFKKVQMDAKNFGYELVKKILDSLGEVAKLEKEPKILGLNLVAVISPTEKRIERNEKTKN